MNDMGIMAILAKDIYNRSARHIEHFPPPLILCDLNN